MPLFGKSISNKEWKATAWALYTEAKTVTSQLSKVVQSDYMTGQLSAEQVSSSIMETLEKLPLISNKVRSLPKPSSSDARQANKHLGLALDSYIHGAKLGQQLFKDLLGGLYERALQGGFASRAAVARIEFEKKVFEETVRTADKHMAVVANCFSKLPNG